MIDAFLKYAEVEQGLSLLTVSSYRTDLRQWERFMRADSPQGDFEPLLYTQADLRLWLASLSRDGLKPRSLRRKAQALKSFYHFLVRERGLRVNPAAELVTPRLPRELPVFIRPEETAMVLDGGYDASSFEAVRDRLIILMLYTTGMRSTELLELTDANVNVDAGELKVHGKRNKDRIIPFGEELGLMIREYRDIRNREVGTGSSTFFVRADGRPLYRKALYNIVHSALGRAGVHAERLSPHVMRHSFATDMLNAGADLNAVSSLMGHASLASTQVYTHITYRELKQNYSSAHPRAQKKGENYGCKH